MDASTLDFAMPMLDGIAATRGIAQVLPFLRTNLFENLISGIEEVLAEAKSVGPPRNSRKGWRQ